MTRPGKEEGQFSKAGLGRREAGWTAKWAGPAVSAHKSCGAGGKAGGWSWSLSLELESLDWAGLGWPDGLAGSYPSPHRHRVVWIMSTGAARWHSLRVVFMVQA